MPPEKRKRIEAQNGLEDQEDKPYYPPEKYKHYLACPFPKQNPNLYLTVNNVCTERWGFKDIGDLNYHIQRVHSSQFGCVECKSRFTQSKKGQSKRVTVEQAKRNHDCKPRDFTDEDPQWMTKEQESRLAKWKEPGKAQDGGAKSWAKIYMCLFGTAKEDVPSPFYDYMVPKHLVSNSSRNDTYKTPTNIDNIDPSLTLSVARVTQDMGNFEVLEDQHRLQLDRNTLGKYKGQDDHKFDWSVKRAMDSGYGSGNVQELQERNASFPQDPSTSITESLLYPEDKWASVMWALGNSNEAEAGIDYDKFLNLEEKSRDSPND